MFFKGFHSKRNRIKWGISSFQALTVTWPFLRRRGNIWQLMIYKEGQPGLCTWAWACSGALCPQWGMRTSLAFPGLPSRDVPNVSGGVLATCSPQWKTQDHQIPRRVPGSWLQSGGFLPVWRSSSETRNFIPSDDDMWTWPHPGLLGGGLILQECFLRILHWIFPGKCSKNF